MDINLENGMILDLDSLSKEERQVIRQSLEKRIAEPTPKDVVTADSTINSVTDNLVSVQTYSTDSDDNLFDHNEFLLIDFINLLLVKLNKIPAECRRLACIEFCDHYTPEFRIFYDRPENESEKAARLSAEIRAVNESRQRKVALLAHYEQEVSRLMKELMVPDPLLVPFLKD